MLQAPMFDGLAFDVGPLAQDVGGSAEVGVCRRHVAQALVVAGVVVVLDEDADLGLQVAGQEVVFQQDPVLQGLMPMGRIDWPSLAPQRSRLSRRP